MQETPATAFIGAGAVATVLARRMFVRGYPIAGVISRTRASAATLAEKVNAPIASDRMEDLPADARWILICVPDDAVGAVATELAAVAHPWAECVVAHTAGALDSGVLQLLEDRGAAVAATHPVQTFTRAASPDVLEGVPITLSGDDRAVAALELLAQRLGAVPLRIHDEDRPRIHLAASMASNFFVTLMATSLEVLSHTRLSEEEGLVLLRPLVERTWRNLQEARPQDVLTGPIARGDVRTIERQIQAMNGELKHIDTVYRVLAHETIRLARLSGHLSNEQAEKLASALDGSGAPPA